MHSFDVRVVGKSVLAKLTADTGLLVASEWNVRVELVVAVDPDCAGIELVSDVECS